MRFLGIRARCVFGGCLIASLGIGATPALAQSQISLASAVRSTSIETPPSESRFATPADAEAAARALWDRGERSSARRLMAIAQAYRQLGRPYQFGGDGKHEAAVDCSAFVQWAEGRAGVRLPRTSTEQSRTGQPVARAISSLVAGDLLFFGTRRVSHVGLYIGGGRFIHASSSLGRVAISSLHEPRWDHLWLSARRVTDGEDASATN